MAVVEMERVAMDAFGHARWIAADFSFTAGLVSDIYLMPRERIYAIAATVTNGTLQFTFDTPDKIDAGTAVFESWDGVSDISLAVTAFKVTKLEPATAACKVMVKVAD